MDSALNLLELACSPSTTSRDARSRKRAGLLVAHSKRRTGSMSRRIAQGAGFLAAGLTLFLTVFAVWGESELNVLALATLLPGGAATYLALRWPDEKRLLAGSLVLLIVAFIPASTSVGWFYLVPALLVLLALLIPSGVRTSSSTT